MKHKIILAGELLKTPWLIAPSYLQANKPFIDKLLNGELDTEGVKFAEDTRKNILCVAQDAVTGKTVGVNYLDAGDPDSPDVIPANSIFILPVNGPLTKADSYCDYGTQTLANLLEEADDNDDIIGHILHINTPGGSSTAVECLLRVIDNLTKPCIAVVSEMCASAGVPIAAACDEILIEDMVTMLGCIGTMCKLVDDREADKMHGYRYFEVFADGSEEKNAEIAAAMDGDEAPLKDTILNPTNAVYLKLITDRRSVKPEALKGRVYIGQEGIDVGLADGFGTIEDAINIIMSKPDFKRLGAFQGKVLNTAQKAEALALLQSAGIDLGFSIESVLLSTTDSKKIYVYANDGEDLTGKQCVLADADGNPTATNVPAGSYTIDDGSTLVVEEKDGMSVVQSYAKKQAEAAPPAGGQPAGNPPPAPATPPTGNTASVEELQEQLAAQAAELLALKNAATLGNPPAGGGANFSREEQPKYEKGAMQKRKEEIRQNRKIRQK